jgi:formylglycine-generating enzyme required for sulfatase activity
MTSKQQRAVTRDVALEPEPAPPASADALAEDTARLPERAKPAPGPRSQRKILFIAANARLGSQLALDEEYRAIERSIRAARHRDAFQLIPLLAARPGDLQQALLEHSPDVVHFACHGSARAELLLLGDGPVSKAMPVEALASLLRVLQDNLALVVLNACFASGQASAIRQHAGIAIGMRERIEDRGAIAFAAALYGALAYGRSVRDAFELGVAAIESVDVRWRHAPELFAGPGIEARDVRLVDRSDDPDAARSRSTWARRVVTGGVIGLAGLGAALALARPARPPAAAVLLASPSPPPPSPPPPLGMARFAAATMRLGDFTAPQLPAACPLPDDAQSCAGPSSPERTNAVPLQPFALDVVEVTNGEFATWLMKRAGTWTATTKGVIKMRGGAGVPLVLASEQCGGGLAVAAEDRVVHSASKASWPVVCVTWYGASEYCRAQYKRLPLEAEWEWAAKGPARRPFPWGAVPPRQDGVAFDQSTGASAHPRDVGTSPQDVSPDGIRDLGGNAAEWVDDGRGDVSKQTIRGGSWASRGPCDVLGSSCKRMAINAAAIRYAPNIGFRCASTVIEDR